MLLEIPALVEFMRMDVPGAGWKWSGVCIAATRAMSLPNMYPAFPNLKI